MSTKREFKSICSVDSYPVPLSSLIKPTHTFSLACGSAGCIEASCSQDGSSRFTSPPQSGSVLLTYEYGHCVSPRPPDSTPTARTPLL